MPEGIAGYCSVPRAERFHANIYCDQGEVALRKLLSENCTFPGYPIHCNWLRIEKATETEKVSEVKPDWIIALSLACLCIAGLQFSWMVACVELTHLRANSCIRLPAKFPIPALLLLHLHFL